MSDPLFPDFETHGIDTGGTAIFCLKGGSGPPLVLLHGYPETHACWHRITPALAAHFTVILPDLRGYGASGIPESGPDHAAYSKRAMAADIVAVMAALGFPRFRLVGHDRGARVAYRLALDHPDCVDRIAVLDVVPTEEIWTGLDAAAALATYHWMFLAQPAPFPERLIGAAPDLVIDHTLASWTATGDLAPFDAAALNAYRAAFRDPARIAAMCEDYRAGATLDREHDRADQAAGHKITAPLLALWGDGGLAHKDDATLEVWRRWATEVEGGPVRAGHFLAEEAPTATLDRLLPFLRR